MDSGTSDTEYKLLFFLHPISGNCSVHSHIRQRNQKTNVTLIILTQNCYLYKCDPNCCLFRLASLGYNAEVHQMPSKTVSYNRFPTFKHTVIHTSAVLPIISAEEHYS